MNEINKTGGIRTKKDLKFFLEEDAKVNDMACGMIKYFLYLSYGMEKAHAYRYIKTRDIWNIIVIILGYFISLCHYFIRSNYPDWE